MSFRYPQGAELKELLNLEHMGDLEDLFTKTLSAPLTSLFARPKKNLRGQIVELGFRIAGDGENEALIKRSSEIVEMLHAGSLVIDDIEDASPLRRGSPSLHTVIGLPLALNAGNWLYFLPFKYIDDLEVDEAHKTHLTRECFRTLLLAHYGQALDIGVPLRSISQDRVYKVTLSAMELKTGVLAGLALRMGGLARGENSEAIERCGRKLGIALQMYDDIGNLTSTRECEKRGEDFRSGRLNFLSSVAANELSPADYEEYLRLIGQTDFEAPRIQEWLNVRGVIPAARHVSERYLTEAVSELRSRFQLGKTESSLLENLRQRLMVSYD